MRSPIFGGDQHVAFFHAAHALEERLTVHGFAHHQLGAPPGEPSKVVRPRQRPIESQTTPNVRPRNHILHVIGRTQVAADVSAVLDADASSAVAPAPGRSIAPAAPYPGLRRNWTSKISSPNDVATRL
jgi:hypothetical protein